MHIETLLEPLLLTGLGFLLVGILFRMFFGRPKNFPPGPLRLPIVGSIPFLKLPIQYGFFDLFKKYGPIFSVYFGNYRVVVLCDLVLIREAFKNDNFSGRPSLKLFLDFSRGTPLGIASNNGQHWAEQRRFTFKTLRDFGFGKQSLEDLINEEVGEVLHRLKKEVGHAIEIHQTFDIAMLNTLLHIITGTRYPHDDPKLNNLLFSYLEILESVSSHGAFYFMPWLAKIAPNLSGYNKTMAKSMMIRDFIQNEIAQHKKTCNYDDQPRDFIDAYLKQIQETTDSNSSFHKDIGEKSLATTLLDLITGAGDTTGTTLSWGILFAIQNPHVQTKVQEEIDTVIGSRCPSLAHRPRMAYMEAFISEVFRMSTMLPIGVFHNTTELATLYGYTIPKGTILIANMWQIHHDLRYWRDPSKFRPDRFINHEGVYVKPETVIPFSTGKRICPGEALARDQLFIFFATLFQQLRFEIDPNRPPKSDMKPNHGLIVKPEPFYVLLKLRHQV